MAIAAIPVTLAYVTKARDRHTALIYGGMFILGLILTHVALGLIAGFGGLWVEGLLGRFWGALLGPILIIFGLMWTGWVRIPLPKLSFRAQKVTGIWGAFTLGIPFSVAVCPFCTPALIVILGGSSNNRIANIWCAYHSSFRTGACYSDCTWRCNY